MTQSATDMPTPPPTPEEIRQHSAEQIASMKLAGVDLVEWSAYGSCPERCQLMDGKLFSISGAMGYRKLVPPPLDDDCRCVMLPVVR